MGEAERFNLFFQLAKVDEAKRLVYGRATQSVPDAVREIFDYRSSKPNFEKWSAAAKARTAVLGKDGQSLGNVREMHRAIAAGKVIDLNFNDEESAIDIGTYCADDSTWKKVLSGVLTGFSIGGKYVRRWPDQNNPSLTRYEAQPEEVSYVDSPAVPTATFTFIKADGTEELRKFAVNETDTTIAPLTDEDTTDPNVGERANENPQPTIPGAALVPPPGNVSGAMPVVDGTPLPPDPTANGIRPMPVAALTPPVSDVSKAQTFLEALVTRLDQLGDVVGRIETLHKADQAEKDAAESKLKTIGAKVGIARKSDSPLSAPSGYSTEPSEYGDPANWLYPCDTKDRCRGALSKFNGKGGQTKYDEREWSILGRRIAQRASTQLGVKYQYSPKSKQINSIEDKTMGKTLTKDALTSVVTDLRSAAQSALDNINDPEAVMSALHQILAGIDVATDVDSVQSDAESGSSSGISTLAANAQPVPVSGTTGSTLAMAAPPMASTTTPGAPTTGASSSTTSSSADSSTDKGLMAKLDALTAQTAQLQSIVELLAKRQTGAEVRKSSPTIGDLNAQVQRTETAATPLEKAINSAAERYVDGVGSDAIQSVMNAANGDIGTVQNRAMDMVRASLAKRGFSSAAHIRLLDPATIAAIRGNSGQLIQQGN